MSSPIASNDGDLLPWLQNFAIKIPTDGPPLGLTAPQISSAVEDCNMLIYLIQTYVGVTRQNAAAALQYKDLIKNGPIGTPSSGVPVAVTLPAPPPTVAAGALPRLRQLVQELKNKPAYNVGIGTNLGIIAPASVANMDPPNVSATESHAGNVTLTWSKSGWSGVKVQTRAQGTAEWTDLGLDLFSPFVDTRPLLAANTPEVREYRMCHLDGDVVLMNWSSVTVVTVKP